MRQRRRRWAEQNEGFSATVSERASMNLLPMAAFFA